MNLMDLKGLHCLQLVSVIKDDTIISDLRYPVFY